MCTVVLQFLLLMSNYLFTHELSTNAQYSRKLQIRPKKSIQLPQLHVLPLSVSLTRENT
jgi:hypothetical protein